jgi:galactonate dehydratase
MPLTLRLPLGVQARRLTAVKTVVVAAGMRNWILVELDTAEGTVGWREASLGWKTRAVVGSLDVLAAFVMGL